MDKEESVKILAWTFPEGVEKETNIFELDDSSLEEFHDQMHVFWKKKLEGYYFDWTLKEIYKKHKEVILNMLKRKIKHIYPIDSLDEIRLFFNEKDLENVLKWLSYKDKKIKK